MVGRARGVGVRDVRAEQAGRERKGKEGETARRKIIQVETKQQLLGAEI